LVDHSQGEYGGNISNNVQCVQCETSSGNLFTAVTSEWSCYRSTLRYINNLYCFGYFSCRSAVINSVINIECNGDNACYNAVITSSSSVTCTNGKYNEGYQGFECYQTTFNDVQRVICNSTGSGNCAQSKHRNTNNIYNVQCDGDATDKCSDMKCGPSFSDNLPDGSFTTCQ